MSPYWRLHRRGFSIVPGAMGGAARSACKHDKAYFSPIVNLVYTVKIQFERAVGFGPFSVRLDELKNSGAWSFGRRFLPRLVMSKSEVEWY
jgi:hypothetical protein